MEEYWKDKEYADLSYLYGRVLKKQGRIYALCGWVPSTITELSYSGLQ